MMKLFKAYKIYWLALALLIIKLIICPFAQVTNADVVSKIYGSLSWHENPIWIMTSVWGPFFYYLDGFFLGIWPNIIYTPAIINIVFSVLTLLPFYYFTKREFNENGAFIASIFLAFCPVLFRNSFLALSETPFLFFIVLAINILSKGIQSKSIKWFVLAGISMTIASGFRYESWILIGLFGLISLVLSDLKKTLVFGVFASIFPVIWMIQNKIATGDFLFSLNGNFHWTLDIMKNNEKVSIENYFRRIWYFPFSWFIALGPIAAFLILKEIFKLYLANIKEKSLIMWSIPFWLMLLIMEYSAFNGVLLLQKRFVGILVVLSMPFIAIWFSEWSAKKLRLAIISVFLTIGFTFGYNTDEIKPLPRLKKQVAVTYSNILNEHISENSYVLIDFVDWETSPFVALHTPLDYKSITILMDMETLEFPKEEISRQINNHPDGIALIKKNSTLSLKISFTGDSLRFNFDTKSYFAKSIYSDNEVDIIKWQK
jgi:4-amino-4-deoxy-L-arabinose transferase-like glycosyltransferase